MVSKLMYLKASYYFRETLLNMKKATQKSCDQNECEAYHHLTDSDSMRTWCHGAVQLLVGKIGFTKTETEKCEHRFQLQKGFFHLLNHEHRKII